MKYFSKIFATKKITSGKERTNVKITNFNSLFETLYNDKI